MQPERYLTERGFTNYDEFIAVDGTRVFVRQSSAVAVLKEPSRDGALVGQIEGPFVWVFLDGHKPTEHVAAHLTVDQAKRLRDALTTFIREAEVDQTPTPTR